MSQITEGFFDKFKKRKEQSSQRSNLEPVKNGPTLKDIYKDNKDIIDKVIINDINKITNEINKTIRKLKFNNFCNTIKIDTHYLTEDGDNLTELILELDLGKFTKERFGDNYGIRDNYENIEPEATKCLKEIVSNTKIIDGYRIRNYEKGDWDDFYIEILISGSKIRSIIKPDKTESYLSLFESVYNKL